MKVMTKTSNVIESGGLDDYEGFIDNNSFMYEMIASGIYGNPKLAMCRETILNGIDANNEAGAKVSVDVCLPDEETQELRVRDYGIGLSDEDFRTVYMGIGKSAKRESNLSTGQKGLGSKSPLAYCDAYALSAYDGTEVRHYAIFMDEHRKLRAKMQGREPSREPRGVEVRVPIQEEDFDSIEEYVRDVCSCVGHPLSNGGNVPNVIASHGRKLEIYPYWKDKQQLTDHLYYSSLRNGPRSASSYSKTKVPVLMGNMVYPSVDLREHWGDSDHDDDQQLLAAFESLCLSSEVLLIAPLEHATDGYPIAFPTAGRDTLQPHPRTKEWLRGVASVATEKIVQVIRSDYSLCKTYYDRWQFWQERAKGYPIPPSQHLVDRIGDKIDKQFVNFSAEKMADWLFNPIGSPLFSEDLKQRGIGFLGETASDRYASKRLFVMKDHTGSQVYFSGATHCRTYTRRRARKYSASVSPANTTYVLDDTLHWKKRLEEHAPGLTSKVLAPRKDRKVSAEFMADWVKEMNAHGFNYKLISSLPKYVPDRSAAKRQKSQFVGAASADFFRAVNSGYATRQWQKVKREHLTDGSPIFVVGIKGYDAEIHGHKTHISTIVNLHNNRYFPGPLYGLRLTQVKSRDLPKGMYWLEDFADRMKRWYLDNLQRYTCYYAMAGSSQLTFVDTLKRNHELRKSLYPAARQMVRRLHAYRVVEGSDAFKTLTLLDSIADTLQLGKCEECDRLRDKGRQEARSTTRAVRSAFEQQFPLFFDLPGFDWSAKIEGKRAAIMHYLSNCQVMNDQSSLFADVVPKIGRFTEMPTFECYQKPVED